MYLAPYVQIHEHANGIYICLCRRHIYHIFIFFSKQKHTCIVVVSVMVNSIHAPHECCLNSHAQHMRKFRFQLCIIRTLTFNHCSAVIGVRYILFIASAPPDSITELKHLFTFTETMCLLFLSLFFLFNVNRNGILAGVSANVRSTQTQLRWLT